MQIRPSQHQSPPSARARRSERTALHQRLAHQRALERRLLRGGGAALVASVGAWAFGAALLPHLLVTALGFGLGLLRRPGRTGERAELWALEWVETQVGLSYRTALELPPAGAADPYGLSAAVRRRAEGFTKRLSPPPSQPWWLPLVVLALLLALLPALNLPAFRSPFGSPGAPPPGAGAPLEVTPDETLSQTPPPQEESAAAEAPAEDEPVDAAASPPERSVGDAASTSAEGAEARSGGPDGDSSAPQEAGEQGALERYLSALGEVEEAEADRAEAGAAGSDGALGPPPDTLPPGTRFGDAESLDGRSSARDQEGTERPDAPPSDSAAQDEATDAQDPSDDASRTAAADDGPTGATQDGAQDEAQPASEDAQAQTSGAQEEAPGPEEASDGDGEDAAGEAGTPAEGGETGAGSTSAQDEGAEAGGGTQDTLEATGAAESDARGAAQAGTQGDGRTPEAGERPGESTAPLQQLPGARDEGGPTQSGEVLRRGADEVELPDAQVGTDFARAAEEAVREGRLPLEYQEIVREYFR